MCKKDTEGGSYCCCKCCTPTVSSIVVAIVGAAILVASFVIAAVVLTMLQDGIAKTARYNSPRSDAKAFNDWLSNVPSKRSTNDASLKYYQYYFFNITNLNAVVTNSLTAAPTSSVLPIVDEIGPYTYRYFVDRLDPTFDADDERLSYKEYYRYIFDPTLSKMGSRQLDDQTDVFTTTSAAYSVIFGNPFNPTGLFGASEFQFRIGTSTQLPIPYMAWLDNTGPTSFDGNLFNISAYLSAPMCSGVGVADCANRVYSLHTMHSSQILAARQAQGYTSARATFVKYGAAIFGTANKWATSPPLEYWDFADTIANNASYKLPATPLGSAQALWLYQPGLTATGVPSCPSLALGVSGTAGCWLAFPSATITTMLSGTIGLTETQVIGIQNYLGYLTFNYWDWLFGVNGHQGASFAATFRTTFPECPIALTSTVSSNYNGGTTSQNCTAYNNGNMYVKATPRSLLFEQYNLLGPFLFGSSTRTFNRRGNISFSTNYSSELDARQDSFTYTVGTGINHINDIDNLYLWKNRTRIPTNITGTWCHKAEDPTYAPGGVYPMQHFTLVPGWTYRQANQAQMTKYTPSFPPGKVSDTNRYSFEKSVLSDKSFAVDLFVGDISRHAKMVFYRDDSVKGIDIQRYTIDDSEFNAGLLFFGQYFKGLANYSCPAAGGVNTFSCYPRYGKLEQSVLAQANYLTGVAGSVLATTGIDLVTIQAPNNDDFLANSQMGPLFGDANELIAMIDLEPISGAALGGTLKQQVNILVQPYIGAYLPNYLKTIQGGYPGKLFRSAAPNSHQARATLMPVYWLNKIGYLSDKQADSFKSLVYGAQLASRVVLIVGSIVGGLMMFVALGFLIVKRRGGYNTQTSKSDLAL